jgi:hypothetical protein
MTLAAYLGGIGVLGPGIDDWPHASALLCGLHVYEPAPTALPMPTLLPAVERRRTGRVVRLALAVAHEAVTRAGVEPAELASVFSSSGADGHNCHEICQALALPGRELSPTRFSNSVHNAPAGYWSIATGAKHASNVLCGFDASFCAGLLEALAHVVVEEQPVLLVAYDTDYPEPLYTKRPVPDAFGTAFVLTPHRERGSLAHIEASLAQRPADVLIDPRLEALRASTPAARCLPLLQRLAMRHPGLTVLDYLDVSSTAVRVDPCS